MKLKFFTLIFAPIQFKCEELNIFKIKIFSLQLFSTQFFFFNPIDASIIAI